MRQCSPTHQSYKAYLVYGINRPVCGWYLTPHHRTFLLLICFVMVGWLFCFQGLHLFITQDPASLRKSSTSAASPKSCFELSVTWLFVLPALLSLLLQCESYYMVTKEVFLPPPHFCGNSFDSRPGLVCLCLQSLAVTVLRSGCQWVGEPLRVPSDLLLCNLVTLFISPDWFGWRVVSEKEEDHGFANIC